MINLDAPSVFQSPKCTVSYGKMGHLDPRQVPRHGQPWSTFGGLGFVSRVDLVLPGGCFGVFQKKLAEEEQPQENRAPVFSRVVLKPGDMLDGVFFTEYIKRGNILMLSNGRTMVDNVFTLKDGTLTMYLDRESYERAGLVGKPHGVKGKRSGKPRWIVTYNLRDPSMLHGKRGFDRLLYACRNVLNDPVTWLFCNLAATPEPDPLETHNPVRVEVAPSFFRSPAVSIPPLSIPPTLPTDWDRTLLEEFAADTYEWLSLVRLRSPRVLADDRVDPYISSYTVPTGDSCVIPATTDDTRMDIDQGVSTGSVCKITWQGFLSPEFVRGVLAGALTTVPSAEWFSLSATTFAKGMMGHVDEVCVLRVPGGQDEYVLWEIKSDE